MSYLGCAIIIQALLTAPLWFDFLTSEDAGLEKLTAGKIPMSVGSKIHPSLNHFAAHDTVDQICITMLLMLLAFTGTNFQKQMTVAIYFIFTINQAVIQFSHPLDGTQPGNFDMPMPLLVIFSVLILSGYLLDCNSKSTSKSKSKSKSK